MARQMATSPARNRGTGCSDLDGLFADVVIRSAWPGCNWQPEDRALFPRAMGRGKNGAGANPAGASGNRVVTPGMGGDIPRLGNPRPAGCPRPRIIEAHMSVEAPAPTKIPTRDEIAEQHRWN